MPVIHRVRPCPPFLLGDTVTHTRLQLDARSSHGDCERASMSGSHCMALRGNACSVRAQPLDILEAHAPTSSSISGTTLARRAMDLTRPATWWRAERKPRPSKRRSRGDVGSTQIARSNACGASADPLHILKAHIPTLQLWLGNHMCSCRPARRRRCELSPTPTDRVRRRRIVRCEPTAEGWNGRECHSGNCSKYFSTSHTTDTLRCT